MSLTTVYGWATDRDTRHTYRFTRPVNSGFKMGSNIALSIQEELETLNPFTTFEVEGWQSTTYGKELTP